jgi:TRAP-type mannitol/chloroaromatic compound transport system substrate-binding protein
MKISRRQLGPLAAAGAATAIASPAIAQGSPTVKWRLTSSYPKSLDVLFGAAPRITQLVSEMTDGKFQLQVFAAGELVPGLQAMDAVANGTVECCHTYVGYYIGKTPELVFDGSVPFGMTPRQHYAWRVYGGGAQLMDELYDKEGVIGFPCGNTGGQMFGWFRKELKTLADFSGLKMRVAGFGGKVLGKVGVIPQQIAGGDVYSALEKGTIDACEWVGPYDDEKLGFNKVAKYYVVPGILELEANNTFMVNKAAWAAIPPSYQTMLKAACWQAYVEQLAGFDAKNAAALKRLLSTGVQLVSLSPEILKGLRKALEEVLDEESAKSASFKKISDNWRAFRAEEHQWFGIADTRAEFATYSSI